MRGKQVSVFVPPPCGEGREGIPARVSRPHQSPRLLRTPCTSASHLQPTLEDMDRISIQGDRGEMFARRRGAPWLPALIAGGIGAALISKRARWHAAQYGYGGP